MGTLTAQAVNAPVFVPKSAVAAAAAATATLAPDIEQEDKAEQLPQDYAAKGEQALGSDYANTYDYPTTEDTNGTLSMEAVCVFQFWLNPPFVRN